MLANGFCWSNNPPMSSSRTSAGLFPAAAAHSIQERFGYRADHARAAWEADIELPSVVELFEMAPTERIAMLRRIHAWQVDTAITDGPFQRYREFEAVCKSVTDEVTGELCLRPVWSQGPSCLTHADHNQIDPQGAEKRRRAKNAARLAALTERALDFAEEVLDDVDGDKFPPSLRAKVMVEMLDRDMTTSKKLESRTEVTGEVTVTHTAMDVISAKLDRYERESLAALNQGLTEIEAEVLDENEGDAA